MFLCVLYNYSVVFKSSNYLNFSSIELNEAEVFRWRFMKFLGRLMKTWILVCSSWDQVSFPMRSPYRPVDCFEEFFLCVLNWFIFVDFNAFFLFQFVTCFFRMHIYFPFVFHFKIVWITSFFLLVFGFRFISVKISQVEHSCQVSNQLLFTYANVCYSTCILCSKSLLPLSTTPLSNFFVERKVKSENEFHEE